MRFEAMREAMNKAVEAFEKENGRPATFEIKLVFQHAFCRGWQAVEHRAYKEGMLDTQRAGREAIGLFDDNGNNP